MPVRIPDALPATRKLQDEGIFVMTESRATHQDIRPLKIAILNLMPTKETTETQLLRLIGNSPLQVDITLLHTATHVSKHTSADYLNTFYRTFDDIKDEQFDGFIITGAPVEQYEFESVDYWAELAEIMDWTDKNVYTTLFICWAAQAGLYHFYNINKHPVDKKVFGIFPHKVYDRQHNLTRGFDDVFYAPHSRHTEIRTEDVLKNDQLDLLCASDEAGVYIVASKDGRRLFVTGHSEYDAETLGREYMRDKDKGLDIDIPVNYYPDNDPTKAPLVSWRAHAHLLFGNWLNYFVYQETPFDISTVKK